MPIASHAVPILAAHWRLDPDQAFLNHGSYGAVPLKVLEAQGEYRARMERDAVRFFKVDLERLMDGVRRRVGEFVNCPPEDLAPVANATIALGTILHSIDWKPGDEVIVTDHEYQSAVNELDRLSRRTGLRVVTARVPFPISSPEQAFQAVAAAASPRTRLLILDEITSATSLILPVKRLVEHFRALGVETLVDGTHAPGQTPVDIAALAPAYYVGSFHKWTSAPKGTGFMYVRPDKQRNFFPIALSSRHNKVRPERALFLRDFDYMGTDDYTAMLAVPHAIDFMGSLLPGGWPALYKANHDLAVRAREAVCRVVGLTPPAPESMIGSMATVIIPEPSPEMAARPTVYDDPLQDALVDRHRIVAPIWRHGAEPGLRVIRISAQVYNSIDQYQRLGEALNQELSLEQPYRATA